MKLARGSVVAERYSILESRPDVETIYVAEDRQNQVGNLQVLVNLRVLDQTEFNSSLLANRVKKLREISSEYLLGVFDIIRSSKLLAVTTETISGSKLSIAMTERIYSTYEITLIVSQVAKALELLHKAGITHGAINENNIYVDENCKSKLDAIVPAPKENVTIAEDMHDLILLDRRLSANASRQRRRSNKNPSLYLLGFTAIILALLVFLSIVTFSPEYRATLSDLAHHIDEFREQIIIQIGRIDIWQIYLMVQK